MSYSFNFRAPDKASALQMADAEFAKVLDQQPVHEADLGKASSAFRAFLELIPEPGEGEEINASVNGYVQWRGMLDEGHTITGACVGVNVQTIAKAG